MEIERLEWIAHALARGYNELVTAEIIYRLPDYRHLVQSFIWQEVDCVPGMPELEKFVAFWEREIEGPIHSMRVFHVPLVDRMTLRHLTRDRYLLLH